MDYWHGGVGGQGFQRCIAARYKDLKWRGDTPDDVYRYAVMALDALKSSCCCSIVSILKHGVWPACFLLNQLCLLHDAVLMQDQ
jgi:hypothetical protein